MAIRHRILPWLHLKAVEAIRRQSKEFQIRLEKVEQGHHQKQEVNTQGSIPSSIISHQQGGIQSMNSMNWTWVVCR
jgi:hypothetical protein